MAKEEYTWKARIMATLSDGFSLVPDFLKPAIPTVIAQVGVGPALVIKEAGQAGRTEPIHAVLREAYQQKGWGGLYSGNLWNLGRTLLNSCVVMNVTHKMMKEGEKAGIPSLARPFVFSPFAGILEMAITVPLEAKERAAQMGRTVKWADIAGHYHKLGAPMALRNGVGTTGTFFGREMLKTVEDVLGRPLSTPERTGFFMMAGLVNAAATVPFDAQVRRAAAQEKQTSQKQLFIEAIETQGWWRAISAGGKGRILSVFFPLVANQVSAVLIDTEKSSPGKGR